MMAPRYDTAGMLPTRAIYPSSRPLPYIAMLVTSKVMKAFGLYLAYDLLKLVHIVVLLFLVQAGSSLILLLLQKPFSAGKRLTGKQWVRVIRGALLESITCLLWLFGLTLTGPLRTTLLYEHNYVVVAAAGVALFGGGNGGPSKTRGAFFLLLAIMGILFFDHDYEEHRAVDGSANVGGHVEGQHDSFFTHFFYHLLNISGLSDHKGGVVLLVCTLLLNTLHGAAARKLSVDVGGAKRLRALTTFVSFLMMAPWAAVMYFTTESVVTSSFVHLIVPLSLTILLVFVIDYYVDSLAATRLDSPRAARIGALAVFVSAMVLSSVWNHPFVAALTTMAKYQELITEDHVLSAGVVFSFVLLVFATTSLTSPSSAGASRGALAGLSAAASGAPMLLSYAEEALLHGSQSALAMARSGLRQILDDANSRRIFYFLCINLSFTFVELLYGAWTNSLGLVSDGFHMLFDCSALVMGLYAAVMSRWKATRIFSFGYDRLEVLSGFLNGLFLVVIAFFVFIAALERLHDPPSIDTERLLPVSVAGLCVNLVGICAFSHAHSHGGAHGHSHGGSHTHGGEGSGGSSSGHGHGHTHAAGSSCSSGSHTEANHGHSYEPGGHQGHGHSHEPGRAENCSHGHSHGISTGAVALPKNEKQVHNTNMQGVYLHVLADTMSSVGVIVSTLLMEYFGWFVADPICSLFIATMIGLSVLPLLRETAAILMLCTPADLQLSIPDIVRKIMDVDGVQTVREHHFWSHSSSVACGTMRIHVRPIANEQTVLAQVSSILKAAGLKNTAVQVEKDDYSQHVIGMTSGYAGPVKATYPGARLGDEIKNV